MSHQQTIAALLHRTACRVPAKTALICGATTWIYREFDALVTRLAAGLQGEGVAKGDRVAIIARNSHGFAALRFALARIGAVLVPINFMLKPDEAAYILRHAGAKLLAVDAGLAELGRSAAALDTKVEPAPAPSPNPTSTAATSRRSSTPAAPSRCPRARCSRTKR